VAVDEARQQCEPLEAQRRARRGIGLGDHAHDTIPLDDDRTTRDRRRPAAVDQHRAFEDRTLHRER
jgi:hypothetical protein